MARDRAYIYIDGFNFYYGAVKGTPYKWLDFSKLCRLLLPSHEIEHMKYFTALVKPRSGDPHQRVRQQTYIRALEETSSIEVIYGHFISHKVNMFLADQTGFARVIKTEEKKSDVNLATHLVRDAFHDLFDTAVLITNDSDFSEPIRVVTRELHKKVGILIPHRHHPSQALLEYATFWKKIRTGVVRDCQLPVAIPVVSGRTLRKPHMWKAIA